MDRVRYYVDEHIAAAVVKGLAQRGVNVITAKDAGLLGAPDEQVLAWAFSQTRVIVTKDEDFLRLHSAGANHAGIVQVPHSAGIGTTIQGLMLIYQILTADDMAGSVEFL